MSENEPSSPSTSGQSGAPSSEVEWQRDLINRLSFAALNEQRRTRRWNIFFKSLLMAYLILLLVIVYWPSERGGGPITTGRHTALIEIRGVISDKSQASADNVINALRAAYRDSNTVGVILRINSPGGSPVQAGYINDEIWRLRKLHPKVPIYAVVTDICASGGYYIASAADKIYADKASIVGSIGVIMNGFGFVDTMKKLGVQRRLFTAGTHKGFLDPFSPLKPEEVKHVHEMLNNIHQQFIDVVKRGRGDRLKGDDKTLFSGLMWTGEEGKKLGLVNAMGSSSYVAREVIGAKNIVDYTVRPDFFNRLTNRLGAAMAKSMGSELHLDGPTLR